MTILIGLAPGKWDDAPVHLGCMMARAARDDVVVLSVVPAPWPPDPYGGDKEYLSLQEELAEKTLRRAREQMDGMDAAYRVLRAESVPGGLLDVISQRTYNAVVVGSSSMGLLGRVMLGGAAERILHSAELPIVVAPRGFHQGSGAVVTRVSVALGRADRDSRLLARAASLAAHYQASLRAVCFAVRPMASLVGGVRESAEQLVAEEWMQLVEDEIAAAQPVSPAPASTDAGERLLAPVGAVLGYGSTWPDAIHDVVWSHGDLLVVGVSGGPLGRVFLGSHASKIVRNAPVPVALLSRS